MTRETGDGGMDELVRQLAYYRERNEALAATLMKTDAAASAQRQELEQKRRGFSLLARITGELSHIGSELDAFYTASVSINPTLNMQRTAVLTSTPDGQFQASILQGYSQAEMDNIRGQHRPLPAAMCTPDAPALFTKVNQAEELAPVSDWLALPYFISVPVVVDGQTEAVLVTGRVMERHPFLPRLNCGDAETLQAIAAFLATLFYQKRLQEVEDLAYRDALTGLPNLRMGKERLLQAMHHADREGLQVAVLYVDLDGFKVVNDTMGHAAGDGTLRTIAKRLEGCLRASDTVARIGGDEFLIVIPSVRGYQAPLRVAEDILETLARPVRCEDRDFDVGASIGISLYPDDAEDAEALVHKADSAMYRSKKEGRNRCSFTY